MDRLRGIEYFVAVAEQGSISSAALALGVSPPAVSKLLKALEAHLGAQLVARNSRGVSLTPDGETYLSRCRIALSPNWNAPRRISPRLARPCAEHSR